MLLVSSGRADFSSIFFAFDFTFFAPSSFTVSFCALPTALTRSPNAPDVRLYVGHVGIGGGYGYNWVLGRKWLLHFSMLPTFVVYNRNNMTIRGERKKAEHIRFNMLFNERAAIVHFFSPRHFAGATLVVNSSLFSDDAVVINQNKWRLRAFLGMRL